MISEEEILTEDFKEQLLRFCSNMNATVTSQLNALAMSHDTVLRFRRILDARDEVIRQKNAEIRDLKRQIALLERKSA